MKLVPDGACCISDSDTVEGREQYPSDPRSETAHTEIANFLVRQVDADHLGCSSFVSFKLRELVLGSMILYERACLLRVGNDRMLHDLQWTGQEAFVKEPLKEWTVQVDGTAAGLTRSAGSLTFATKYGAEHMVPYDKPAESLL